MSRTVYLPNFDRKVHHAGHYLGSADDLDRPLAQHRAGRGARLVEVFTEAGIGFRLARTWDGDRTLEGQLKRRKEAPRLCPICTGRSNMAPITLDDKLRWSRRADRRRLRPGPRDLRACSW